MRCAFHDPLRRFYSELAWLKNEFVKAVNDGNSRRTQLCCEMVVIRLHDSWARVCREIVILSALGNTTTLGGSVLSPSPRGISGRTAVIPSLLSTYHKKKYEPKWYDATECIDAAQRLAINNLPNLAAALGATNSPAENIKHVRNFYAHRKEGTSKNALSTGCFSNPLYPAVFELNTHVSGGSTVIETWIDGLTFVVNAAAQ
jgi:hypothetical protein